jgi:hypothetical protein
MRPMRQLQPVCSPLEVCFVAGGTAGMSRPGGRSMTRGAFALVKPKKERSGQLGQGRREVRGSRL